MTASSPKNNSLAKKRNHNAVSQRVKNLKTVEKLNNVWLQKKLTSPSIKRV